MEGYALVAHVSHAPLSCPLLAWLPVVLLLTCWIKHRATQAGHMAAKLPSSPHHVLLLLLLPL